MLHNIYIYIYRHSIKELLEDKVVQSKIENSMAMSEISVLNKFYEILQNDPDRAVYGLKSVSKAVESQTIQTLLITDQKFPTKSWKELIIENDKLRTDLKWSKNDVNVLNGKVGVLERDIEMSEQSIKRLTKETMSNADESQNFRRSIQDLE